jgi:hypothetical protein
MSNKIGWELGKQISYNISIKEKVGTETLAGIGEFTPSIFTNGTKELAIHWGNGYGGNYRLDITIDFEGGFLDSSNLKINCTAPSAREIAISIGDNIFRLIESHRTYNWVFTPFKFALAPLILGIASFTLFFAFVLLVVRQEEWLWQLISAVFLGWIFLSSLSFRPYISFDTRRQQLLDRLWRYFSFGTIGFVIFGTLFPLFRKAIVGF